MESKKWEPLTENLQTAYERGVKDGMEAKWTVPPMELEEKAMKYTVINLRTKKSHGVYDSLDEARGCVAFDRLSDWEIWADGMQEVHSIVAYRDTGRF